MSAVPLLVAEARARTFLHTWRNSTVVTVVTPVLFLAAMGLGLGSLVDRRGAADLAGGSYLAFLAPGLMAASALVSAVQESAWPVRLGVQWQKTYVAALSTPLSPRDLVDGHLLWVGARLLAGAAAFAVAAVALGAAGPAGAALAVVPAVLTGLAVAAPIAAWAVTLERDAPIIAVIRFGVTPMWLFSGTFFPLSQLPGPLRAVAALTPMWHGVELSRAAMLSQAPALPAWVHMGYLALWLVAGLLVAHRTFTRRLLT
jgi:lipooligosaccharide transport system permease protein